MDGESLALVYLALAKWVSYLGLLGLTGAVATRVVILPRSDTGSADPTTLHRLEHRLSLAAALSAGGLLVGVVARLYAQTYSVFGLDEPVTLELVRVIGVDSRWGARWMPQAGAALASAGAVGWAAVRPRAGWRAVGVAVAAAWVTLPMTGHAMTFGTHLPWVVQIAHGAGAGLWIGGLAMVLACGRRLAGQPDGDRVLASLVTVFSPLAIGAVAVLLVTGGVTTWLSVDAIGQLWTTSWGGTLLLKVCAVAATGAVGAYNWRRLTPRLGDARGSRALRASASVEMALAIVVLAVTAVLVHLAMPHELE